VQPRHVERTLGPTLRSNPAPWRSESASSIAYGGALTILSIPIISLSSVGGDTDAHDECDEHPDRRHDQNRDCSTRAPMEYKNEECM
jgi:hypothetical protein